MHRIEHEDADIGVSIDFSTHKRALSIEREGRTVVAPSPIGITTPDGEFPAEYELVGSESRTLSETVRTAHGKRRVHHHHGKATTFEFESATGREVAMWDSQANTSGNPFVTFWVASLARA